MAWWNKDTSGQGPGFGGGWRRSERSAWRQEQDQIDLMRQSARQSGRVIPESERGSRAGRAAQARRKAEQREIRAAARKQNRINRQSRARVLGIPVRSPRSQRRTTTRSGGWLGGGTRSPSRGRPKSTRDRDTNTIGNRMAGGGGRDTNTIGNRMAGGSRSNRSSSNRSGRSNSMLRSAGGGRSKGGRGGRRK